MVTIRFATVVLLFLTQYALAEPPINSLADVQRSHIDGNVPPPDKFDQILHENLSGYFKERYPSLTEIQFELLRLGPTQTGIANPKFYAWIKILSDATVLDQGVVRLAAIERTHFEVTSYFSNSEIHGAADELSQVFPAALVPVIKSRAELK